MVSPKNEMDAGFNSHSVGGTGSGVAVAVMAALRTTLYFW